MNLKLYSELLYVYKHTHVDAEKLAAREYEQFSGRAQCIFDSFTNFKYISGISG